MNFSLANKSTVVRAVCIAVRGSGIDAKYVRSDEPDLYDDEIELQGKAAHIQINDMDGLTMQLSYWEDDQTMVHGPVRRRTEDIVADVRQHFAPARR